MPRTLLIVGAGLAALLLFLADWNRREIASRKVSIRARLEAGLPGLHRESNYVSSSRCQACHPGEYASWHRTFHRTMTQVASPETVLGSFDGTTIQSAGLEYRVSQDREGYWADMPDPDVMMYVVQGGRKLRLSDIPRVKRPVVMTTGSHHYQTYWVASERYHRLLQTLPLVYLKADQRWIPREAAFMRDPAGAARMITQWNHHCIRCHSTGGNPGLDDASGQLLSEVGELGIACEACHGPAERHVALHQDPINRYRHRLHPGTDETIVNPARLDHRRSSEVCGQCHGVYITRDEFAMEYAHHGPLYHPGEPLDRTRYYVQHPQGDPTPERLQELRRNPDFFRERWWDDGSILAGGREYTALSVTACYTRGTISCLSCHSMHASDPVDQLKPGMATSAACTACHGEPRFTTDLAQHTFHPPDSAGSDCLNCHMPHTTYALLRAVRSHQIASPQARSSARFGVPNACNLCHLDKTLAWTDQHLRAWYQQPAVPLSEEQRSTSAALLWLLKGHAAQRAITAWHVGWQPAQDASGADWLAPFQAQLLADPYGVVRYVAAAGLRRLPGFDSVAYDFLAPADELQRQVVRVRDQWRRNPGVPGRVGEAVLLDSNGNLLIDRLTKLVAARDDRPVTIKE